MPEHIRKGLEDKIDRLEREIFHLQSYLSDLAEWDKEMQTTEQFLDEVKNQIAVRSPEMLELAREVVKQQDEEDEMLAKMTQEERDKYIEDWATNLAKSMCDPDAIGGP